MFFKVQCLLRIHFYVWEEDNVQDDVHKGIQSIFLLNQTNDHKDWCALGGTHLRRRANYSYILLFRPSEKYIYRPLYLCFERKRLWFIHKFTYKVYFYQWKGEKFYFNVLSLHPKQEFQKNMQI